MNGKDRAFTLLKVFFGFLFSVAMVALTYVALSKYFDQPVATFITYTKGDDDLNINFPSIIIYNDAENVLKFHQTLKNCKQNATGFYEAIHKCLKNGSEFDLKDPLEDKYDVEDIIGMAVLASIQNGIIMDIKKYFKVSYGNNGRSIDLNTTEFGLKVGQENYAILISFKNFHVLTRNKTVPIWYTLHTNEDVSDARDLHAFGLFDFVEDVNQIEPQLVKIKKQIMKRESTRKSPCGKFNPKTCNEIEKNQKIAKQFNCKVPFLQTGQHLDAYITNYTNLPDCNKSLLLSVMDLYMAPPSNKCKNSKPCSRAKFSMKVEKLPPHSYDKGHLILMYEDIEVEHYTTYIHYDFQSLIGEVGGVLGMTLGLSGLSITYFLTDFLRNYY